MDKRLLTILRCPVSHKSLSLLKKDKLAKINAAIANGEVETHEGTRLDAPLAEALVTDDGKRVYPVNDGIPVLLEGESIHVEQFV
ncbi:MAG: Trm112 family protein [Woeseiaceae bacterium]|nr:Trm112 family protein [Woeseiaceae bacterium]